MRQRLTFVVFLASIGVASALFAQSPGASGPGKSGAAQAVAATSSCGASIFLAKTEVALCASSDSSASRISPWRFSVPGKGERREHRRFVAGCSCGGGCTKSGNCECTSCDGCDFYSCIGCCISGCAENCSQ
jgi:hypothetical protein